MKIRVSTTGGRETLKNAYQDARRLRSVDVQLEPQGGAASSFTIEGEDERIRAITKEFDEDPRFKVVEVTTRRVLPMAPMNEASATC